MNAKHPEPSSCGDSTLHFEFESANDFDAGLLAKVIDNVRNNF